MSVETTETPPQIVQERRAGPAAWDGDLGTPEGELSGCRGACWICNDHSPPEKWDAPWPAYRWSAELEETQ